MITKKQVLVIPFLIGITLASLAVAEEKEFVWGITDAAHKIFPDQPYTGPLGNKWQLDAARNEYESCQLVGIPLSVDMRMAEVWAGDFRGVDGATIPASATTVRIVRTIQAKDREWPDPLPEAYPIDILRRQVQSYWITVHVPADAKPGTYTGHLTIASMSTGGRSGKPTKVPLALRVRDFTLPTLSRYQMVGIAASPEMRPYHIVSCSSHVLNPRPRRYLDAQGNLRVDFDEFDTKVEQALAEGVTSFSIGLTYVGADQLAVYVFDWQVPVEGQNKPRRIWARPVYDDPDADTPEIRKSRKYFTQYLSQIYQHLEAKGWTQYFWVYGADEPHDKKWVKPLTRYFALIKEVAPKLRIMITQSPTKAFGPNLDIACIMMNHLRAETIQSARKYKQELWTYSCGKLNNPALTIAESDLRLRLWYWLQEKWDIQRVLLWHTSVGGRTFIRPGTYSQGAGDGQLFYRSLRGPDGKQYYIPSIRVEMLRDGIEDREYIFLLKKLTSQLAATAKTGAPRQLLRQAKQLALVPDELVETQFAMTSDLTKLLARRAQIANMIEKLQAALRP